MGVHAIIGCGRVSGFHVTAAEVSGIKVGYFVDSELDKAHALAAEFNAPAKCVGDPMEAISDPTVTSASICVPHWLHTDIARKCLENGVDVIVEPLYEGRVAAGLPPTVKHEIPAVKTISDPGSSLSSRD